MLAQQNSPQPRRPVQGLKWSTGLVLTHGTGALFTVTQIKWRGFAWVELRKGKSQEWPHWQAMHFTLLSSSFPCFISASWLTSNVSLRNLPNGWDLGRSNCLKPAQFVEAAAWGGAAGGDELRVKHQSITHPSTLSTWRRFIFSCSLANGHENLLARDAETSVMLAPGQGGKGEQLMVQKKWKEVVKR